MTIRQAHIIWIASIVNIGIGFIIPEFNVLAKSISHVALESPIFAYTHRAMDVIIGVSMCTFAFGLFKMSPYKFSVATLTTFLLGCESPRVCQRLNNLRNWNYEKIKSLYIRIS